MSSLVNVAIHPSQFPDAVRRDLLESLRSRQVNHKFHYDSIKQTQKWLALHQAYSPSRTDPDCAATYDRSFAGAVELIKTAKVHLIGLGCGGGQKDTRLLKLLRDSGKEVSYTPADVSTAMVLVARQAAMTVVSADECWPLVCDLAATDDLPEVLEEPHHASRITHHATRLITCFGMLPNFERPVLLSRLAAVLRPNDWLLLSANLAPGPDYSEGLRRILPLYNNALTRDWLMTFLLDLGVEADDGELGFVIEDDPAGSSMKRVAAYFKFSRSRQLKLDSQPFEFRAGEQTRLFFSYRHTPALVRTLLKEHGLATREEWVTRSEEEGVFLVHRV